MPQCKLNFLGAHGLDPEMPKILWDRMHEDEWRSFVADINYAIREAQSTMNMSPWVILAIVGICISLVVVDIAVGGVFGNPTAGVITMAVFTLCGTCVVCYTSLVKPTSTLEEMIEIICEDYSDDEQEIYFFYRHHANVRVTENRFYLEVFVQEDPLPPYEPPQKPRKLPEEQPEETDWEPDTVGEEETEATSTALVPFKDEPDDESQALVPFQEPTPTPPPFWHALVPFFGKKEPPPESQALVPLDQPPPPETSQALVPLDQPPTSQALVPLGQEPETSQALVPLDQPETSQALVPLDQPPPESQALVPLETSMVPRDGQPQPPPDMSQALVPHEPDAESRSLVPLDVDRARQALAALNQQQLAPPVASDEPTMPVTGQVPYGSDYRDPAPYSQHMPPPLPGSRDPAPYSYPPPGQPGDPAAAAVPPGTEGPVPYGENFRDPAPYSWFPRFGRAAPPPAAPPPGTARQVPPAGQPPEYAAAVPPEGPVPYGENFRDPAPYSWLPGFGGRAGQQQQAPPPAAGQAPPPAGQQVPPGQPPQYAAAVPPPEGAVPYGENYRDPAPYSWLPGFGRRGQQAPPQGQQGQPAQYAPPPGTEGTGPVPYGEHFRDPAPYSATYPRPGQVPPPGQQQQQGDPTQLAAAVPQAAPPAQQPSGQTRAPHSTSGPRPAQVQTPWWKLWAQPTEPAPAPAPATVPVAAPSDDDESSVEEAAAIPAKKKKKKKKKAKQPKKPKTVPVPDESQESMVSDESSSSEYDESSSSEYDESSVEEAASIPAKKEKKKKKVKPPKKPKTVPVPDESPQSMVSDESSSSEYESSSSEEEEEEESYTAPKAKAKKQSRAAKNKKLGKLDQDVEDLMDESDKKSESFADWGTQTAAAAKKKKPAAPMPWADEEAQAGEELEQIEDETDALAKEQAKNAAAFDAMSAMRRFGGGWSWGASSSSKATAMEEDDKEEDENTAAQQAKMADLRKSLGSDKADSSVPWTSDEELGEEIAHDDDALMAEHAKNKAALRGKASKGRPSVMDEDDDDSVLAEQEQNAVAQARMEDLRKSLGAGKASGAAASVPWTSDEELGEEIEKLKEDDETLLYEHAKNKAAARRASEAGAETAPDAAKEDDEMDEGQAPSTVAKAKMSELRKSLKAEAVASLPWALDEDDEIAELEPLEEEDDDLMLEHEKNTAAFSSVAAMRKSWTDPESGEAKAEEASAVKGADDDDEEEGWDKEQGPSEATRELARDLRKSWVAAGFLAPEPEPAAAVPWATDEEAGVEVELEEIEDIDDLMEEHARNTAAVERAEAAAAVSDGSAEDDDDDEDVTTNRDSKGNVFFDL